MADLEATARICPFLGLPDDPDTHFSFADLAHRCWARDNAEKITLAFQASVCLGGSYPTCDRFQAATRPIPAWHPGPGEAASPALEQAVRSAAPTAPTVRGSTRSRWRAPVAGFVLLAVALLVLGGAAYYMGIYPGGSGWPIADVPPTTSPPAVAATTLIPTPLPPTVTPTAVPTATSAPPTATSTPTARPSPTTAPEPTPTPLIHVVQRGETLLSIATLYGVTAGAIANANGIEDKNNIHIGQELVIPTS